MLLAVSVVVIWDDSYTPSMAALLISWSIDSMHNLKGYFWHSMRTQKDMVSLERVLEFSSKPQEVRTSDPVCSKVFL